MRTARRPLAPSLSPSSMANAVGPKPIVLQRALERFLVKCPTTYEEAIEKARRVFKYAQDDMLSLSCIAADGEKAQIYADAWECLVPTMLVVFVEKEEIEEGRGTIVLGFRRPPRTECEPSVAEPEPSSSEAEEEAEVREETESVTGADEEVPPTSRTPSPADEKIIIVLQLCESDSTTHQQQYKLRRRTKISKAFNRFEMDMQCDRREVAYLFNGQVIDRDQSAEEIGIQHGDVIRAVRVT